MAKSETQRYREKILTRVLSLDVAGYIFEEVEALLTHIHYYKLKNILQNADTLLAYLRFLDKQNTQQFEKIICNSYKDIEAEAVINMNYFLSDQAIESMEEKKVLATLNDRDSQAEIQNIMLSIKGLLLLTANEFCHASTTRISINKLQRERKLNAKKKK